MLENQSVDQKTQILA